MAIVVDVTVTGLPAGPVTEARLRKQVGVTDDTDDLQLEAAINSVNALIVGWPCAEAFLDALPPVGERGGIEWPWRLVQGGVLLAARIFSRRNSTEGVATFGVEGVAYVIRNDPDVAMMLNLGQNRIPKVG